MTSIVKRYPYSLSALLLAVLLIGSAALLGGPRTVHSASSMIPINGYAWSDNVGWISLNCATGGPAGSNICGTSNYGLTIDGSGNITGYAWSDNVGWISANTSDLAGCPNAPCTATVGSGGALSGWLRAIDGIVGTSSWNGFISLSGTSPNYGVTITGGVFSGYAWGSDVVGWTDFEYASTTYGTCTPSVTYTCSGQTITQNSVAASCVASSTPGTTCVSPGFCQAGDSTCAYPSPIPIPNGSQTGNLTLTPQLTRSGKTIQVSWDIGSVVSCTVTGSDGDSWSGLMGTATSSPINEQVTYKLSCVQDDPAQPPFTETAVVSIVPAYQER